ncbi:hypothetical protein [Burkholderia sp. BCC0405]|uniref:hypothetical protein n=1 Tax=Burkholderia sp. BCC0405 TaxID=2676298 RepID=UPI00158D45FE|nr:hypothetical protein [Burkholderia sp. BCC0405]
MANPPLIAPGPLNRILTSIVVSSFPTLNVTAPYMGKSFARVEFEGDFVHQIETGTSVVNSPEPYVMATITVGLLRSQALAQSWMAQAQTTGILGDVTGYPDTTAFSPVAISQAAIRSIDPGAWDGTDPIVRLVIRGVFNLNSNLWNLT